MVSETVEVIEPQEGPQATCLGSSADIAIYGGAAGGGKSWALKLDALRGINDPNFRGVMFRRVTTNLTNQGGLVDESRRVFGPHGELVTSPRIEWRFPSGATIQMSHLQHEKNKEDHKGAQYTFIGFDELTEFTETQIWYLLSRNRSPESQFRPWMRATTNPDADSWVRDLIRWWLDDDGYPIPERSGFIRWFVKDGDELRWLETQEDLDEVQARGLLPMSFTFIAASLHDNRALMDKDPQYLGRLQALDSVERAKLLGGCWNVSHKDGMFKRHKIGMRHSINASDLPAGIRWVRYWDLADTEPSAENKDPDWTAGVLLGRRETASGPVFYLRDVQHFRNTGAVKHALIRDTAERDGQGVSVGGEQEPGATGKEVATHYRNAVLAGFHVEADRPSGSKLERAKLWLAHAETPGRILVVTEDGREPDWLPVFIRELESFPHKKKDQIDATSGAFKMLERRPVFLL